MRSGQRLSHLADVHPRPRLGEQRAQLEVRGGLRREGLGDAGEEGDRLRVVVRLQRRLAAGDHALDPVELPTVDPGGEELRVDLEPVGDPPERGVGRPELVALDLAHVLLRETAVRELGLREAAGDSSLPDTLPERGRGLGRVDLNLARHCPVKDTSL